MQVSLQNTDSHLDARLWATSQNNLHFSGVEEMLAASREGSRDEGAQGGQCYMGLTAQGAETFHPRRPSAEPRLSWSPQYGSPASSEGCLGDTQGPSNLRFCHFVMNTGGRKVIWTRSTKNITFALVKGCVCVLDKVISFPGWLYICLYFE